MSWLDATRTRAQLLLSRRASESRTDEEFRFHLDMETDRLVREVRLSRDEARRRALAAFGGVQNHRESMLDGRGLASLSGMSLDLKLGGRMMFKYPELTIVGGLAMAFAIWVGAVVFEMVTLFVSPTLPLPQGDRIVTLREDGAVQRARIAVTGYASYAGRLTSVEEALTGKALTPEHIEAAAGRAIEGLDPREGTGGNAGHTARLVAVYGRRALTRAAVRARR